VPSSDGRNGGWSVRGAIAARPIVRLPLQNAPTPKTLPTQGKDAETRMAKGKRDHLVDLVVSGTFRHDRHGGLLLTQQLPKTCPLRDANAGVEHVWSELVAAQERMVEERASDPWGFSKILRRFYTIIESGDFDCCAGWVKLGPAPSLFRKKRAEGDPRDDALLEYATWAAAGRIGPAPRAWIPLVGYATCGRCAGCAGLAA
jgi:hypothetical protein